MITVTIHAFAKYRDLFGEETKVEVPEGATIYDALIIFAGMRQKAQTELFEGATLKNQAVLMYNHERIDSDDANTITLEDGDEVVLYPPVSGG